jgi:hypothetical protein
VTPVGFKEAIDYYRGEWKNPTEQPQTTE